jgi:uncharacterized membrane protein
MGIPIWVLTILYWVHILATVIWLGSQVIFAWLKHQEGKPGPNQVLYETLVHQYQRRLVAAGWLSLLFLAGTGMFQLSSNVNYHGFLVINNLWGVAILIKHILYAGLIGLNLYLTWGLAPALERTRLRYSRGLTTAGDVVSRMRNQEAWLFRINLGLTLLILVFTALARSA